MNTKQIFFILVIFTTLFGCKKNNVFKNYSTPLETDPDLKGINNIIYNKPESCVSFFKTIDFSSFCLSKNALRINEFVNTSKASNIAIYSSQLNGGELDVSFYYESDPNKMAYLKLTIEAQKKMVPNSTFRNVNGIGDYAFIVYRPMMDAKVLVVSISNIRVIIQSKIKDKKEHCIYTDAQLIKMANAIVKNIN